MKISAKLPCEGSAATDFTDEHRKSVFIRVDLWLIYLFELPLRGLALALALALAACIFN